MGSDDAKEDGMLDGDVKPKRLSLQEEKRRQIDRNMKLAFEETLAEPLSDKLADLVTALKKKERGNE